MPHQFTVRLAAAAVMAVINVALGGVAASALPPELRSTAADQEAVAVTIYNQDLALVKELRRVTLGEGQQRLALREVSARMRPETAQLRSVTDARALTLIEQNFDFDLLTPAKLLEKYVGRKVRVVRTNSKTGIETIEEAEVLAAAQGVVLKIGDRIETGIPGRIVYDKVPDNLRDRPTLVMSLENRHAGAQQMELSYLTGGLSWQADYVAELDGDDKALDLNGWVTLTNQSGASYRNAKLQLVAGDVNRIRDELRYAAKHGRAMAAEAPASAMAQESLFEYHLYTLGRPTTIAENQTKQVALLAASRVPVSKELLLSGSDYYYRSSVGNFGQKMKLDVYVEFKNDPAANLGMPLPKGIVRVYKKDRAGNAQFIGEDRIDHTPKHEKVRLKLGQAFDVTADKKQTDFRRRDTGDKRLYEYESAYEIVLKNAKSEPVTVTVQEPVPADWRMLEETHKHEKAAAGTARWRITVPAEGSSTLRYRVRVRI
ncbi:MAG: hypothetical protein AMJ84_08925 [Acidithiobacillales bacterium SM23_46]|jgi:hypothetical protein|nr:MAG: hypothetical protein AMJ84_08925 [Acidithiobacillales bacterium SM23_46]KPL28349.1 MAG: hypothetical protein AMJ72_03780 [Acidithiobacillales bacterium SM1_46]